MTPSQDTKPAGEQLSLLDILRILVKHWLILAIVPPLGGATALGLSFLITPTFTASGQIMTPQNQSTASALLGSLGGLAGAAAGGAIAGLKNPADQWIGLLKSRTIADAIVDRFKLVKRYDVEFRFQARDKLEANSSITSGKDSLIDISVSDRDPKIAAAMSNAYVEELQKLSKSLAVSEAAQRRLYFQKQLEETKDQLVQAENALQKGGLNERILKTSPEAAVEGLSRLKAQIIAMEVQVAVMTGSMTNNNPELRRAERELASLRAQLAAADKTDISTSTPNETSYVARFRRFKYYETLFELIARQYELARADEAKDGALIQIVDEATVPEWKSAPKRGLMAVLATFTALIGCIAFVLVRHQIRLLKFKEKSSIFPSPL